MDAQLQQLIELQTKQNQLLERYLWRIRFSLLTLLLLTTAICCCLSFIIYTQQTVLRPTPTATIAPPRLFNLSDTQTPPQPTPARDGVFQSGTAPGEIPAKYKFPDFAK
jgi:hypothetical protein